MTNYNWKENAAYDFTTHIEDGKIIIENLEIMAECKEFYYASKPPNPHARGGGSVLHYTGKNLTSEYYLKGPVASMELGLLVNENAYDKKSLLKILDATWLYEKFQDHKIFKEKSVNGSKLIPGGTVEGAMTNLLFTPLQELLKLPYTVQDSPFLLADKLANAGDLQVLNPKDSWSKKKQLYALNGGKLPTAISLLYDGAALDGFPSPSIIKPEELSMVTAYIGVNGFS